MHVCDDISKMDLKGTGCEDLDWFRVAQGSYEYANELLGSV
jgi:hypothetical protein